MSQRIIEESELASLAQNFRENAGKTRTQAARELGVAQPTLFQAEEEPKRSLNKLRKQIIERYSEFEVVGPVFLLRRKSISDK